MTAPTRTLDAPAETDHPIDEATGALIDRRERNAGNGEGLERRQFGTSRNSHRPEVNDLAEAVDTYKLTHRRRFITYEELMDVILDLGYTRD